MRGRGVKVFLCATYAYLKVKNKVCYREEGGKGAANWVPALYSVPKVIVLECIICSSIQDARLNRLFLQ